MIHLENYCIYCDEERTDLVAPDMCSECSALMNDPEERKAILTWARDRHAHIVANYAAILARITKTDFNGRKIIGVSANHDHAFRVACERYERLKEERLANNCLQTQRSVAYLNNEEGVAA